MNTDCLSERDLILLHYGEAPEQTTPAAAAAHLAACADCQARRAQLASDLSRIPPIADPDPAVATRIAARVTERLARKTRWLPAAGAAVAGAVALAMAVIIWAPDNRQLTVSNQPPAVSQQPPAAISRQPSAGPPQPVNHQATLDLELLDKLELLEELETLRAIEGV